QRTLTSPAPLRSRGNFMRRTRLRPGPLGVESPSVSSDQRNNRRPPLAHSFEVPPTCSLETTHLPFEKLSRAPDSGSTAALLGLTCFIQFNQRVHNEDFVELEQLIEV